MDVQALSIHLLVDFLDILAIARPLCPVWFRQGHGEKGPVHIVVVQGCGETQLTVQSRALVAPRRFAWLATMAASSCLAWAGLWAAEVK